MKKIKVGEIEGYDVLYLPERNAIFCKNTVLPFNIAKEALTTSLDRLEVPSKNLTIKIFPISIELGCLTVSKNDAKQIYRNIQKFKTNETIRKSTCTNRCI